MEQIVAIITLVIIAIAGICGWRMAKSHERRTRFNELLEKEYSTLEELESAAGELRVKFTRFPNGEYRLFIMRVGLPGMINPFHFGKFLGQGCKLAGLKFSPETIMSLATKLSAEFGENAADVVAGMALYIPAAKEVGRCISRELNHRGMPITGTAWE